MSDYLIISSSGGGGHKIAAEALYGHKLQKNPENRAVQLDVMRSGCSYGSWIGKKCTDAWDKAQARADVEKQHYLVKLQPLSEALFFLGTFFTVLNRLLQGETLPKKVICTQPLHLLAITAAVRTANTIRFKEERKITKVDLYLTDLPTEKAIHFLGSLRRLHFFSRKSFNMMRVHSPEPVCKDVNAFWKSQAHLQPHQIKTEPLPVSAAYKNPDALPLPKTAAEITIKTFTPCEKREMEKLYPNQNGHFQIAPQDKVDLLCWEAFLKQRHFLTMSMASSQLLKSYQ